MEPRNIALMTALLAMIALEAYAQDAKSSVTAKGDFELASKCVAEQLKQDGATIDVVGHSDTSSIETHFQAADGKLKLSVIKLGLTVEAQQFAYQFWIDQIPNDPDQPVARRLGQIALRCHLRVKAEYASP